MNADPHGLSEPRLRKPYEAPKRRNVLTGLELSEDKTPSRARRDCASQLFRSEFWNFTHNNSRK
jgi:hypothetical protein